MSAVASLCRFQMSMFSACMAWTLTVASQVPGASATPGVKVHCTINHSEQETELIETIEGFVDDWRQGLERFGATWTVA